MPDARILSQADKYSEHEITQTYLSAENGVARRVRKSMSNGNRIYMYNEKRRVSPISCIEDEREISAEEYAKLLSEKEPETETVIKLRRRFTFGEQVFEVDSYPFLESVAVCETELPREDCRAEFPDFIEIIAEVSGDKVFSNHSIAKTLYSGKNPFSEFLRK